MVTPSDRFCVTLKLEMFHCAVLINNVLFVVVGWRNEPYENQTYFTGGRHRDGEIDCSGHIMKWQFRLVQFVNVLVLLYFVLLVQVVKFAEYLYLMRLMRDAGIQFIVHYFANSCLLHGNCETYLKLFVKLSASDEWCCHCLTCWMFLSHVEGG